MSDDEQHNQTFEQSGSGASLTYPAQASSLRKNGFVLIKGHPCKIVDMSTSKTGKHGHAKIHIVAMDIFTAKKYEDISPSTHNVEVPIVQRSEYSLVDIDVNFVSLMNPDGTTKDDVRLPEGELGQQIREKFEEGVDILITCLKAMGEEHVLSWKEAPNSG